MLELVAISNQFRRIDEIQVLNKLRCTYIRMYVGLYACTYACMFV